MDREIQQRLHWVELYSQCKDAGLVCRRCGILRPTLRKWWQLISGSSFSWVTELF